MAGESIFTGKSVDEAIADGLRALGLSADAADIEVISRGSRGIFGLGSEPAQVRITRRAAQAAPPPLPAATIEEDTVVIVEEIIVEEIVDDETVIAAPTPENTPSVISAAAVATVAATAAVETPHDEEGEGDEPSTPEEDAQLAALATELLSRLVELMGFEAEVIAEWREPDADNEHRYLLLDLQGRDLSPLIGRRGDTLGNMQYLVRLMINQRLHRWKNIVVDVEGYRQRRWSTSRNWRCARRSRSPKADAPCRWSRCPPTNAGSYTSPCATTPTFLPKALAKVHGARCRFCRASKSPHQTP